MTTQNQSRPSPTTPRTPPEITPAERARRAKSIHSIRQSQRIEGGDISPHAQELFAQYVDGTLTLDEVGARLRERYGLPVK
ncbi:antitoxin VbhA family protein [Deinococcus enclensis]|uniref:Antitoxin VbhA domain-containing protein n=1 Tax=Deinococcus enclensis TaxID=1049582 RepID=A0ABT9MHU1_9DEIO|nr:antitoxin VbhA family protein [Deinococcus enclensis]MDP9766152.1 hypothetical protein [Deinococcus enclensis]